MFEWGQKGAYCVFSQNNQKMDVPKHHISESVKELLRNPYFILWYYDPTEGSEAKWIEWLGEHPEKGRDIPEAKAILESTKLNKRSLSQADSLRLFNRIQADIAIVNKRKQQRRMLYSLSAACVIFICFLGSLLYTQMDDKSDSFFIAEELAKIDSTQTEVELEFMNREKVLVANKSTIKFNKTGVVHVNEDEIMTVVDNPVEEEKKEQTVPVKMNTLRVPQGRHTSVKLPDGSVVWVNSGTILQFPGTFEKDNRTIYADGEVYLEVTKDSSRPFHVKTSQMDIKVLGTCFNVTAYSDEEDQSVVLAEGGVEVKTKNGVKQRIHPNDRLVWKDDKMSLSQVDTYDYISWKDGVLLFNNQPLSQVAQRLSRYYRKQITCDPDIANQTCTGKLVLFDDFNKVLQTLQESLYISYEMEENTIKLSTNTKK